MVFGLDPGGTAPHAGFVCRTSINWWINGGLMVDEWFNNTKFIAIFIGG